MTIEEYKDSTKQNRIRLTADNGKIIYASTESYHNIEDARQAALDAAVEIIELYQRLLTEEQKAVLFYIGDK